jgi:hypothetical protein
LRFITLFSAALIALGFPELFASDITSRDAYAPFDEPSRTWTMGASVVEAKLRYANGDYTLSSFGNKLSHRQYVSAPNR